MQHQRSAKTITGVGEESLSRSVNITAGKRSSVMNVVLGEDAIDSQSNSDDETPAKKSKPEEWFGNPELLDDVMLDNLTVTRTREVRHSITAGRLTTKCCCVFGISRL